MSTTSLVEPALPARHPCGPSSSAWIVSLTVETANVAEQPALIAERLALTDPLSNATFV